MKHEIIKVSLNGNIVNYSIDYNGMEIVDSSNFNNPGDALDFFKIMVDAWLRTKTVEEKEDNV